MLKILRKLAPYKKAVAGFLTPGLVALGAAVLPGSPAGTAVTQGELYGALAAMLATAGIVFKVTNKGGHTRVVVNVDGQQIESIAARVRDRLAADSPAPAPAKNTRKD